MQTVLDVDEQLLSLAVQKARREGKSLGALVEDALRAALGPAEPAAPAASAEESAEADDAFFTALEEIRALGRSPASLRQVSAVWEQRRKFCALDPLRRLATT